MSVNSEHDVGDAVWSDGIMLLTGLPNDVCRCHNAASSECAKILAHDAVHIHNFFR
jgi:hypothetical protein